MPSIGNAVAKTNKDKRFQVYLKASIKKTDSSGTRIVTFDTVYADDPGITGTTYEQVNTPPQEPWILVFETSSFKLAKDKFTELAKVYGETNVKTVRVIDIELGGI